MEVHSHCSGGVCQTTRHINIGSTGVRIARGVVVDHHKYPRTEFKAPGDDLADAQDSLIRGAAIEPLLPQQSASDIEVEHAHPFVGLGAIAQPQIIPQRLWCTEKGSRFDFLAHDPAHRLRDHAEVGHDPLVPNCAALLFRVRRQRRPQRPEIGEQFIRSQIAVDAFQWAEQLP